MQKKSPLLTSLMEGSSASVVMTQSQAPLVASQGPQQQVIQGAPPILQQQGQLLQINNHQMAPVTTSFNQTVQRTHMVNNQTMSVSQVMGQQQQIQQTCLRSGCSNPAIESPDWDKEYCSNECVVSHCSLGGIKAGFKQFYPSQIEKNQLKNKLGQYGSSYIHKRTDWRNIWLEESAYM
ncbi:TOX high mobility group box family member 4-A-like isoform X2 [Limulus polyphemus]|uniref:TOX high mobility group box family member 4-A-like isoform X2 n=1 Tax=Limulus polyphemus TaxID=6850 RepID=A0ABM1T1F3_LIMPO|nr:TOX high mobility group box family member 4-A-like isoform X2 [Limulus polyphemus]